MRLKTQFAVLTAAVTLLPIIFGVVFFGVQQAPKDPREPTRVFLSTLADRWNSGDSLTLADLQAAAEEAGIPLREVALVSADGRVLESTFSHIEDGSQIKLNDLNPPPAASRDEIKPEIRFIPLDRRRADSPVIVFDIQPFWTKQDIRNRNGLLVGGIAVVVFLVAGIISLSILRSISRAIKTLESDTAIVATGDLDHEVAGSGNHEILLLAESINRMRLNLKDMLNRRSRMLMGVSHDLKTPIALIQGYADALADDVATDADTRNAYVGIIQEKARQLEDLTGELIDFLKIGGDGSVSVREVDPAELLRALGPRFESDARLLSRTLAWGFGDGAKPLPDFQVPEIVMNRPLAERAIENLVTNAFKYSREGGTIGLTLVLVENRLAFSIVDDGPGISKADAPYVFDAFYRGSPSRSDGGHGFGLTIVKAIADLHGWEIRIGQRRDGLKGTEALLVMSGAK